MPRRTGDAGLWRSTWDEPHDGGVDQGSTLSSPQDAHPARGSSPRAAPPLRVLGGSEHDGAESSSLPPDPSEVLAAAEGFLVRRLRSKSLSVSEARDLLRGFEHEGQRVQASQIDDVLDDFGRRGYLDDATLAWHLVTSGVERKGQGRIALARSLAQRGIPREVIDEALAELPDDDAERALDFARSKARAMSGLDPETALRRLVGQLARRGYNGAIAMTAAKAALREAGSGRPSSGVRFVDSD